MNFMIAAYLVIWLASFVLIFNMVRQQAALQRDIATLKELLENKQAPN